MVRTGRDLAEEKETRALIQNDLNLIGQPMDR